MLRGTPYTPSGAQRMLMLRVRMALDWSNGWREIDALTDHSVAVSSSHSCETWRTGLAMCHQVQVFASN